MYTHRVSRIGIFRRRSFQFELVEAAHVRYMGDGDMFKMEDVGDEKSILEMLWIYEGVQGD